MKYLLLIVYVYHSPVGIELETALVGLIFIKGSRVCVKSVKSYWNRICPNAYETISHDRVALAVNSPDFHVNDNLLRTLPKDRGKPSKICSVWEHELIVRCPFF
jgi:hypothetical protein